MFVERATESSERPLARRRGHRSQLEEKEKRGKRKKNKEEERKQDWVENTVTQSYFNNSRSHYTALNRETPAWDTEEDMHL